MNIPRSSLRTKDDIVNSLITGIAVIELQFLPPLSTAIDRLRVGSVTD